jgi:catechol 2,3-dioxygenase-like lactoylglutathione lyase family enzyme
VSDHVAFNHVGQCVTDLERSKRFYCELLGFTLEREINPPDEMSAQLMGLTPPLTMTASYLVRDGLVLELLQECPYIGCGEVIEFQFVNAFADTFGCEWQQQPQRIAAGCFGLRAGRLTRPRRRSDAVVARRHQGTPPT